MLNSFKVILTFLISLYVYVFEWKSSDQFFWKIYTLASNGLNPIWNETFHFSIHCPEAALLRFNVEDGDFVTDPFIGQAVYPLDCIRTGNFFTSE